MSNSVFALAGPVTFYVVLDTTDTVQNGTIDHPFKTVKQGIDAARRDPNGGIVCFKASKNDANYDCSDPIPSINPPRDGASISRPALYVLLGISSLILVAIGWFVRRRARTLPSRV
jgi:hypothetical protein